MKILKSVHNSEIIKRFLIPKDNNADCKDWVDICIDYSSNTFTAKKINSPNLEDGWEENNDYTFPSSLLNEFLRSANV